MEKIGNMTVDFVKTRVAWSTIILTIMERRGEFRICASV